MLCCAVNVCCSVCVRARVCVCVFGMVVLTRAIVAGVQHIVNAIGFGSNEYRIGKTKVFIREPKSIAHLEARYNKERHRLATSIQAAFKGHMGRQQFLIMKDAVNMIARQWRIIAAKRHRERLQRAIGVIKEFLVGYIHRNEPVNNKNRKFLKYVRLSWLRQLRECLPVNVLDKAWITNTPPHLEEASRVLQRVHRRNQVPHHPFLPTLAPCARGADHRHVAFSDVTHDSSLVRLRLLRGEGAEVRPGASSPDQAQDGGEAGGERNVPQQETIVPTQHRRMVSRRTSCFRGPE
eukprot:m.1095679 g.1095679  ORF g.1095679 m.1095679 type:complete len:293 (-) comp24303_c1_seq61:2080-2958(-)